MSGTLHTKSRPEMDTGGGTVVTLDCDALIAKEMQGCQDTPEQTRRVSLSTVMLDRCSHLPDRC